VATRRPLARSWFRLLHTHRLIYNTCWEDPRLDRVALGLGPDDVVVVITSAGCNALDYALAGPRHVFAVDMNPRQNALLELKQAAIRRLDYETFFELFGHGRLRRWPAVYRDRLRADLAPAARRFWDRHPDYFTGSGWRPSLYFHGTTGLVARLVNAYLHRVAGLRDDLEALLAAGSLADQADIYRRRIHGRLWRPFLRWALARDALLSMLAVPRPQREHLERDHRGGIAGFIEERLEAVFTRLPLADNYFWRVYLTGRYTRDCCPEYLQPDNFARLKAGLVDRVTTHTDTLEGFLATRESPISRFVLLDHMDWLCEDGLAALAAEWRQILRTAAPGTRILWRSGGTQTAFVDALAVEAPGGRRRIGDLLRYDRRLADDLHARDRVHTYGSFHIAHLLPS
jgi:S-adenosylmethionine-diacylglycerol 3-amino-3-carboxypropyl transferase